MTPILTTTTKTTTTIPSYLIYETINNKPFFYKGYEKIICQQKIGEDIMGSSGLQAIIISTILRFLYKNLSEDDYEIVTNEAGLHLGTNDNLAADIGIYDINVLTSDDITDKYLEIAPKIVIEVDTKADTQNFDDAMDYYYLKTEKLLDFGVEKVIWITSKSKKIMVATSHTDWRILSWKKDIEIIEDIQFSMARLLKQRHIVIE